MAVPNRHDRYDRMGLAGVWATIRLIKGGERVYRNAVLLLATGTIVGAVQVIASLALRGKAVPANIKLYFNALTLLLFLLLRLPGIRQRVDFKTTSDSTTQSLSSGMTAILTAALVLSIAIWVGDTHVHDGYSWVMVLREPLNGSGSALLVMGVLIFIRQAIRVQRGEVRSLNTRQTVQKNIFQREKPS